MNLFKIVNEHSIYFTDSDFHIWNYISHNLIECENLSINDLAEKTNVSRTSVLRFSKKIGLKGYSELKFIIAAYNQQHAKKNIKETLFSEVHNSYNHYIEYLHQLSIEKILELIYSSKTVYIYSTGAEQELIALDMKYAFLGMNKFFVDLNKSSEMESYLNLMTINDIVIIISYSGETIDMLQAAETVKSKNIPIISITTNKSNTLTKISNHSLYVSSSSLENPYGQRYYSMVNYYILVDFIVVKYIEYCKNMEKKNA